MKEVIKTILKELKSLNTESYYIKNSAKVVKYPYAVFSLSLTNIDQHADGCYMDVDIFGNEGLDQVQIETLSESIKMHFRHFDKMLEDCYMRTQFQSMQTVPTNLDNLQRRNLRFYIKIDWRK
ncbi:Uncharacterised protein [Streptococcus pneumoniae]|uniref:hypothetical protein n=1 Tax=Streptococcus pneumoniae TaxID=1313 RepID=UPI0010CF39B2|nr:hypothetical protein [Streptococcus pneumoniae]MDY6753373.1 hypothetical protein [Streptococcus pneumoniae]VKJ69583.1 Uncharacterised protein [Streptococcus pneumoniae]VMK38488.1 Uncharacterised protein [Streptococcus pneumoniae]VNS28810.1 Uncharacterised protein [Streptococcus pneumoniae]VPN59395.1 Uncharacterised protein [Streptococcus pneumoniae]